MEYIVYTPYTSYSVLKEDFDAMNFLGANVFDPSTDEMFIVIEGKLVKLSEEEQSPETEEEVKTEE